MLIKTITFTFENCEQIEIEGKYIGDFLVDGIHTRIARQGMNWIGKQVVSDRVGIEIHSGADRKHSAFGCPTYETTVFDRICAYKDITHIDFFLYDQYAEPGKEIEEDYHYSVNWTGDSEWENAAQEVYRSVPGNLYVSICESEHLFDLFEKEIIDDIDCMNTKFEMYDIGGNEG